jgi:hypothetical protein
LLANATTGQDAPGKIGSSTPALGDRRTMPKEGILLAVSSEIPVESCFFRKSSIILGVGFDGK